MNFFILGLPRHRTTWLSTFFTYQGTYCFHDLSQYCSTVNEYMQYLLPNHGDSSTGMGLLGIEDLYPDSPKIIIDGDPFKSIQWATKNFALTTDEADIMGEQMVLLHETLSTMDGHHVPYDDIDKELESMWYYITHKTFDRKRAEYLKQCNIQPLNPLNMMSVEQSKQFVNSCLTKAEEMRRNRYET